MNRRSFAFVIATALLIFWGLPVSAGGNGDLVSVIQTIRGQIVQIVVPVDPQTVSKGTGFWLNDKGLVSTCWHVVAGNPNATIQVLSLIDPIVDFSHHHYSTGMWQPFPAKVVAKDALNDIALLQAEGGPFVVPKARTRMGETELTAHQAVATLNPNFPQIGAEVVLAGFPLGQPYLIVQRGTVAAHAFDLPGWPPFTAKILVSTVSNHDNSGAPIFDEKGEVVGVLEGEDRAPGQEQERTGISVVIPAFYVSELAKTVRRYVF